MTYLPLTYLSIVGSNSFVGPQEYTHSILAIKCMNVNMNFFFFTRKPNMAPSTINVNGTISYWIVSSYTVRMSCLFTASSSINVSIRLFYNWIGFLYTQETKAWRPFNVLCYVVIFIQSQANTALRLYRIMCWTGAFENVIHISETTVPKGNSNLSEFVLWSMHSPDLV